MRLIDADKLIEDGWRLERHGVSNVLVGIKSIADVPTAYDLDAVVKKLKKESYVAKCLGAECRYANLDRAIEIVRKGGVNASE